MKKFLFLSSLLILTLSCGAQQPVIQEVQETQETPKEQEQQETTGTKKSKKAKKEKREVKTRIDDRDSATRDILPIVGKLFPIFSEKSTDGKTWTNRNIEGRVTVFYLWYQGCVPALSEMGELSSWKIMYPDVQFFSATWHDVATTLRITRQYNFNWTHLYNVREIMTWVTQGVDENNATARNYPVTIVIDQQGFVRRAVSGTDMNVRQETLSCIQQLR